MNDVMFKPIDQIELAYKLQHWLASEGDQLPQDAPVPISRREGPIADAAQSSDIWDQRALLASLAGDEEILSTLLNSFCETVPERLDQLQAAVATGDFEQVESIAHRIKGGAAQLQAEQLRHHAQRLEQAARNQESETVASLGPEMHAAAQLLLDAFQQYLHQPGRNA